MRPNSGPTIAVSTFPLPALRLTEGQLDRSEVRAGLRLLKRCGATQVDVTDTWLPISTISQAELEVVRSCMDDLGLVPCGVSVVRRSVVDPTDSRGNYQHTLKALAAAVILGAPVVSIGFHEPLPPSADGAPFWALETPASYRKDPAPMVRNVAREAAAMDLEVALELYEGGPIGSGRLTVELIDRIGEPNVGVNLDVGNLHRSPLSKGETWQECVSICLPHTNFWHAKNYRRIYEHPTGRHVGSIATMLSDGDIDYRLCMTMAREAGYAGPVIIEQYGGDGLAAQAAGVIYLQEVLESQAYAEEVPDAAHR